MNKSGKEGRSELKKKRGVLNPSVSTKFEYPDWIRLKYFLRHFIDIFIQSLSLNLEKSISIPLTFISRISRGFLNHTIRWGILCNNCSKKDIKGLCCLEH